APPKLLLCGHRMTAGPAGEGRRNTGPRKQCRKRKRRPEDRRIAYAWSEPLRFCLAASARGTKTGKAHAEESQSGWFRDRRVHAPHAIVALGTVGMQPRG